MMSALASSFGCHRDAIRRALKREGVELRSWRTKVEDPARVVVLYESGQTAAQIAAEFGVSATAVLNHLRGAGVVLRPRGKVPR
jgi:predicted transcriptional regulator